MDATQFAGAMREYVKSILAEVNGSPQFNETNHADASPVFTSEEITETAEDAAEKGLRAAVVMVEMFHKKNNVAALQRLSQLPDALSDTLDFAAATLSTTAEQLGKMELDDDRRLLRAHLLCEELAELIIGMRDRDEVKTLDALADLLYVLLGTAATLDLPLAAAFTEVHKSNMTKERQPDDEMGARVRDKGPNYVPPNLEAVLGLYRRFQFGSHAFVAARGECLHCGMSEAQILSQVDSRGRGSCKSVKVPS